MSEAPPTPSAGEFVSGRVGLRIGAHHVELQAAVPKAQVPVRAVLPLFRLVTDAVVGVAASEAEARGERISCRAGCGACCRQVVPITLPEARRLAEVVDEMPEPRRSAVQARFRDAVEAIARDGWLERFARMEANPERTREAIVAVGLEYFRLGVPCPFLEQESCSIYGERPLVCRQFLVTSPAAHCADPTPETVRTLPLQAHVTRILAGLGREEGTPGSRVPLTLLLEWVAHNPDAAPRRSGMAWAEALFKELSGAELPKPAQGPLLAAHDPDG